MLLFIILLVVIIYFYRKKKKKTQDGTPVKKEKMNVLDVIKEKITPKKSVKQNVTEKTLDSEIQEKEEYPVFKWDDIDTNAEVVLRDEKRDKSYIESIEKPVVIGTSEKLSTLCLEEDEKISVRHCLLVKRGEEFFLKDLNSETGTYLNGNQVNMYEKQIFSGDIIRVGDTELHFFTK